MCLYRHVPSHLTVAGQRVLLSYEGQPDTCSGCGEAGHMYRGALYGKNRELRGLPLRIHCTHSLLRLAQQRPTAQCRTS